MDNDNIAELKISKPWLEINDKKLEEEYSVHNSTMDSKSFIAYQILMILFWVIDLIFEGVQDKLPLEIITKSLKLVMIIIGFFLLVKPAINNFTNNFFIYFSISIICDIISIYLEKSDNDIKIFIHTVTIFIYPTIFYGKKSKIQFCLMVVLMFAVLPA